MPAGSLATNSRTFQQAPVPTCQYPHAGGATTFALSRSSGRHEAATGATEVKTSPVAAIQGSACRVRKSLLAP